MKMGFTPSNVVRYNEYYPFGLQTANSWTRENNTGNNFLANSGTELNATSNLYDLDYRQYDPVLGRLNGIDPMATKYASLSPYNFSFNDPVTFSDPSGADPYQRSDDTWWVSSRTSLYGSRYSGFSSAGELAFQNPAVNLSTNPWAWTGMSTSDIYGGPADGLFLGRGHYGEFGVDKNGQFGYWEQYFVGTAGDPKKTGVNSDGESEFELAEATVELRFVLDNNSPQLLLATFGFGELLASTELGIAGLKPTFDAAAYFGRLNGGRGTVPLHLKRNIWLPSHVRANNALQIGRINSSTAIKLGDKFSKVAKTTAVLGVLTTAYDIGKDGKITSGDVLQGINTILMIAFFFFAELLVSRTLRE